MKRIQSTLLIALVLVLAVTVSGCGGTEEPTATPTMTPTPEATPEITSVPPGPGGTSPAPMPTGQPATQDALDAFRDAPIEWQNARYISLATMRQTAGLIDYYQAYEAGVGPDLQSIGIPMADISWLLFSADRAAIYDGSFDTDAIEEALSEDGYESEAYLGGWLWIDAGDGSTVAMIGNDRVILAEDADEARLCLSVIEGWGRSMMDDGDFEDTVTRVPADPLRIDSTHDVYGAPLATCTSVHHADDGRLAVHKLSRYADDAAAEKDLEDAEGSFVGWVQSWNLEDAETAQIRNFVRSTGTADIGDVDRPLGYWTHWLQ